MQKLDADQFLAKRNQFYRTVFGYSDNKFIKGFDADMNYLLSSKKTSFILTSPGYIIDLQSEINKQHALVQQLNSQLAITLYECARTGKADERQLGIVKSLVQQNEAAENRMKELNKTLSQKTLHTQQDADHANAQYYELSAKVQQIADRKAAAFREESSEYAELTKQYHVMTKQALDTGHTADMLQDALLSSEIAMLDSSAMQSANSPKTSDLAKIIKVNWNKAKPKKQK